MINKLVSSKSVIAKIIADLDLDEDDMRISDIREWIGEAVLKIGAPTQLNHKVVILPLCNYQTKLPCDLEKIDFVAFSFWKKGGWVPMKKSTGYFTVSDKMYKSKYTGETQDDDDSTNTPSDANENAFITEDNSKYIVTEDGQLIIMENNEMLLSISQEGDLTINTELDNKKISAKIVEQTVEDTLRRLYQGRIAWRKHPFIGTNFSPTAQYELKPGYLYSNIPCGYIKLSYFANYTDEDGLPMIPDNPSYFEAIYWYVAMKLIYIDYFKGNKPQSLYYDAKRSYNFYRNQAYAEAMMPDQNDIMNISRTWHTLVPEIESYDTFLSTTGDEQVIRNQNCIWR